MQEHRATSSNTFRERMTIRALNSLERATNFSEMTAVRKFMAGTAIVGSMFGSGITAALAENISENQSEAMSRTAHIDVRFPPPSQPAEMTLHSLSWPDSVTLIRTSLRIA